MNARMQAHVLADRRLHLNDGPIDLIIGAEGAGADAALRAATRRFSRVLDELCAELPLLRAPVAAEAARPMGAVARRMETATRRLADGRFITPMAAVAGAVADDILTAMVARGPLTRAYVNNGGDIALHLAPGASFSLGVVERPEAPTLFGATRLAAEGPVRGVATSGWRGRSFSLGIACSVTILAIDAASADAAATLVANAVDLPDHPAVARVAACDLDPQSDLGARPVTRAVGPLGGDDIARALDCGARTAEEFLSEGWIVAAALRLQGVTRIVGRLDEQAAPAQNATRERIFHD